ncbi:MAG: GDSL-type esterase/lipase family protein [Bacteroidales bacterium]|nr:GDSL-type esterase/lipase family protein [Bacteroidales bacterium]OQB69229.1 MAG: GDSL-like Lipase/Acylhydrolase [Bacteroidetes bacterium ADurb.Bin139]MDD3522004.1 GDSL-type esterase/lipase family protein [Bacteroidales bacterium]MDD4031161.1 GDSL-type esterase/lipase family protein [Bacteroidales bacterium]MDD4435503.1 GDSL-type esterase/lipase family protein [Bacteroidales bacterium]
MKHLFVLALLISCSFVSRAQEQNAQPLRPHAVFLGNSITQNWSNFHPDFFRQNNFVGKGIGGEVTSQMLTRFRTDVLELQPCVVVILAGTNDIAQNQGYVTHRQIMDNIASMADLARFHNIRVILCSVLPAENYRWRSEEFNREVLPCQAIQRLNQMIRQYALDNDCEYVDFWTPMSDGKGAMKEGLSSDGVHPHPHAYSIMEELVAPVISRLCGQ